MHAHEDVDVIGFAIELHKLAVPAREEPCCDLLDAVEHRLCKSLLPVLRDENQVKRNFVNAIIEGI